MTHRYNRYDIVWTGQGTTPHHESNLRIACKTAREVCETQGWSAVYGITGYGDKVLIAEYTYDEARNRIRAWIDR